MKLKNWLFGKRTRTVKSYATINSGNVRIYEKTTSPASAAGAWVVALAVFAVGAAGVYHVVINPPPTTVEWVAMVISLAGWSLPTLLTVAGINKSVRSWYRQHFKETHCDRCGVSTTYEHIFDEHYDFGKHRKHHFCTTDCREQWERENVEYEFSGYYDIQAEGDKERLRTENYSSAYYVDGDPEPQGD